MVTRHFRAIRDKRNKRSVWTVSTKPLKEAHFATFSEDLIEPCVLAGCPLNGVVMDPFFGSGTTGLVALKHGRNFIGIELNPEYIKIAEKRLSKVQLELIHELG
ncbi:DNA-methyltransferase [Lysinibacillus sp. FSL K6-0102]|uniref:DNA-methyltransferase n=1 Tax=Lysinibacillus sp. FSL K6-0102 TaxID=2975290 RepID=UPI0028ECCCF5|nr:site-specific DNA-methyltransferase [uncultured Lysinibacillus sp.]